MHLVGPSGGQQFDRVVLRRSQSNGCSTGFQRHDGGRKHFLPSHRSGDGKLRPAGQWISGTGRVGALEDGQNELNPSNDSVSGEKPLSHAAGAFLCPDRPVETGRPSRLALCTMLFVSGSVRWFTNSQSEAAKKSPS